MSVFSEMDLEKKYEGDPFAEDDELLNTAGLEAKTTPSVVTAAPESPEPPASPAPAAPADKATEDEEEEAKRKAHKEAEAKRKAEFEARQAEKKAAEQEQLAKLEAMGVEIDKVIDLEVPDETIKRRLSGRRVCGGCGASYHLDFKPPRQEGVCDSCGKALIVRKDDEPATVQDRLNVYHKQTEPVKAFYAARGKLCRVEGQEQVEDTSALVLKALES